MDFKEKAKIQNIFKKYLEKAIKDVDDGVLVLEGNKSYIDRINMDFLADLNKEEYKTDRKKWKRKDLLM